MNASMQFIVTITNVKGSDYVNNIANYCFSDSRFIVYGAVSGKTDGTSFLLLFCVHVHS